MTSFNTINIAQGKVVHSYPTNRKINWYTLYCFIETRFITLFSCFITNKRFLSQKLNHYLYLCWMICKIIVTQDSHLFDQVSQCEWTMSMHRRMTNLCPGKSSVLPLMYHLTRFRNLPDQKRRPLRGCNSVILSLKQASLLFTMTLNSYKYERYMYHHVSRFIANCLLKS